MPSEHLVPKCGSTGLKRQGLSVCLPINQTAMLRSPYTTILILYISVSFPPSSPVKTMVKVDFKNPQK